MRRLVLAATLALCGCGGDPPERGRLAPGQRFIVVGRAHDVGSKELKAYAADMKDGYLTGISLGIYGVVVDDSGDPEKANREVVVRFEAADITAAKIDRREIRPVK